MKRDDYHNELERLNLTDDQKQVMGEILVSLMKKWGPMQRENVYSAGVVDGINHVCRFIDGEGDAHDIFED